jgi:hypothetical protein
MRLDFRHILLLRDPLMYVARFPTHAPAQRAPDVARFLAHGLAQRAPDVLDFKSTCSSSEGS